MYGSLQTVSAQFHPEKIQEDKGNTVTQRPLMTSADAGQVMLPLERRNLRRFVALVTSEQIKNAGVDEEHRALVKRRIASGYYGRPEVERETAERLVDSLLR